MKGGYLSGPSAAFILAFFFLPWITVSCDGNALGAFTGYQLAVGVAPVTNSIEVVSAGWWLLWLVPLAAVVTLLLLLWSLRNPVNLAMSGWGQTAVALVALLAMAWLWQQSARSAPPDYALVIEPALWGTLLGLVFILIGGVVEGANPKHRTASVKSASAPSIDLPDKAIYPVAVPVDDPAADSAKDVAADAVAALLRGLEAAPPPDGSARAENADLPLRSAPETEVLAPAQEAAQAWLVVGQGEKQGTQYQLGVHTLIGRTAECQICLEDTAVSGNHAQITWENGRLLLQDLNSTNGCFVRPRGASEWQRIQQTTLTDGMQIKCGRTVFYLISLAGQLTGKDDAGTG